MTPKSFISAILDTAISRKHMEFHRYKEDDKNYWCIIDKSSLTRVYVNGKILPQKIFLNLNHNDIVSIGGNHSIEHARCQKRIYVYQVKAPKNWYSEESEKWLYLEDEDQQINPGNLQNYFINII